MGGSQTADPRAYAPAAAVSNSQGSRVRGSGVRGSGVRYFCPIPYTWPSVRTTRTPSEIAGVDMITSFISFFAIS